MKATDSQTYWRRIRKTIAELTESHPDSVVYIANVETGAVRQGDPDAIAACLIEGTHRLATAEEIAAYREQDYKEAEAMAKAAMRRVPVYQFAQPFAQPVQQQQPPQPPQPTTKGKA